MPVNPPSKSEKSLYEIISKIIINVRNKAYISINTVMVEAYLVVFRPFLFLLLLSDDSFSDQEISYTLCSQLNTMCLAQNILSMNKCI
jgi:hypothetical protein